MRDSKKTRLTLKAVNSIGKGQRVICNDALKCVTENQHHHLTNNNVLLILILNR